MRRLPVRAIGMVWYRREDYQALRSIMADGAALPALYDKWFYNAEKNRQKLERGGNLVERVYLDPDEFPEWCRLRGLDIDSQARTRFVNEAVARKYRNQG